MPRPIPRGGDRHANSSRPIPLSARSPPPVNLQAVRQPGQRLFEMALVWSRLAEYAAKTAARKERTEFINPTSVDGERAQHIGVKVKNPNAPAVAEEDWGR